MFLDDIGANVKAARAIGMKTIKVWISADNLISFQFASGRIDGNSVVRFFEGLM